MPERRTIPRRKFAYYMKVYDEQTGQVLGYLSDISTTGFRLDCNSPLSLEKAYTLNLELTSDLASKSYMIFKAQTRWCKVDPTDPTTYQVGFELKSIAPSDNMIYQRMVQLYGS
jgi:hypothetical protein